MRPLEPAVRVGQHVTWAVRAAAWWALGTGLAFASSVWVIVDRWPPLRGAGGTVVAACCVALVGPAFFLAAGRQLRDTVTALDRIELDPSSGPLQLLWTLIRSGRTLSPLSSVPGKLAVAAAATGLVGVALPFAVATAVAALVL